MRIEENERAADDKAGATVRAWDLPTRLFHWTLVVLLICSYVSRHWGDAELVWHKWNGYGILILVVFRILWGFCGSSTARFASFLHGPVTSARYGIDFLLRRPRHFLGHNPLGGTVVYALLGLLAFQGISGLFSYDDGQVWGPLAGKVSDEMITWFTRWHLRNFWYILLVVIGLHIAANILYLVWKGENLIGPMLTGKKPRRAYEDQQEAEVATLMRALVCLVAAAVIVLGSIAFIGGKGV